MSFAADMKDFVAAFKATSDVTSKKHLNNYYDALAKKANAKDTDETVDGVANKFAAGAGSTGTGASTDTPGSGGGAKVDTAGKAKDYMSYLVDKKGMSPHVAAGIVGNIQQESGFDHTIVGDKGHSFGLFQANDHGERPAMDEWAGKNKRDLNDPYAQLDYVSDAMQKGPYRGLYDQMNAAKDPRDTASLFMNKFERPNVKYAHNIDRQKYAMNAYSGYTTAPNAATASASSAIPVPPVRPGQVAQALPTARPPGQQAQYNAGVAPDDEEEDIEHDARGGLVGSGVKGYAAGGPVTNDDPNDQSNNQYYAQEAARTQALPTQSAPAPAPQAAAPQSAPQSAPSAPQQAVPVDSPEAKQFTAIGDAAQNPLQRAIDGGLKAIQAHFTPQTAVPSAQGSDGAARLMTTTEGAADHQDIAALQHAADPDGKMPPEMARVYGLSKAYEYFASKGDKDSLAKANSAAASLILYAKAQAQTLGNEAVDAINRHDPGLAQKYLISAYNQVPDGQHATLEGGQVVFRDMSGNVTQKMPAPGPEQVLQMAKAAKDGSGYFQMLMQATGKTQRQTQPTGPSEAYQRYQQENAQPQQTATPAGNQPTQPATPQGNAPAPAPSGNTQVASSSQSSDAQPEEAQPDSFMPKPAEAPSVQLVPTKPRPNTTGMKRDEAAPIVDQWKADNRAIEIENKRRQDAAKPAKGKADDPTAGPSKLNVLADNHKTVLEDYLKDQNDEFEDAKKKDPNAVEPPKLNATERRQVSSISAGIQLANGKKDDLTSVQSALALTAVNPKDPKTLPYVAKEAKDGSAAVAIRNGPKLILDADTWSAVKSIVERKQKAFAKADEKKPDGSTSTMGDLAGKVGAAAASGAAYVGKSLKDRWDATDRADDPTASEGPWNASSRSTNADAQPSPEMAARAQAISAPRRLGETLDAARTAGSPAPAPSAPQLSANDRLRATRARVGVGIPLPDDVLGNYDWRNKRYENPPSYADRTKSAIPTR